MNVESAQNRTEIFLIKIRRIRLQHLAVLLQYYKDFNMVWTKVWVKLIQTCIASDTQFLWFDLLLMILLSSSRHTWPWCGLNAAAAAAAWPDTLGVREPGGTDQKCHSRMDSLATAGHQLSSETAVKACRWIKQQSVIPFLYVWWMLFSYALDKWDLSLF